MQYLIALPIRGEAFYLSLGKHSILVDGGWSSAQLANSLKRFATSRHIDIVVCTHADSDHLGGLTNLLGQELSVGQLWLPGAWVDVIPDAMRAPEKLARAIVSELDKFVADHPDFTRSTDDFEQIAERLVAENRIERQGIMSGERGISSVPLGPVSFRDYLTSQLYVARSPDDLELSQSLDEPSWFKRLREETVDQIFELRDKATTAFDSARRRIRYRLACGRIGAATTEFWLNLVDTASNIRKVAEQAIQHNVPVRWFDFDEFARTRLPRGGIPGLLVPLNAVEQWAPPQKVLSYLAKLSPRNEESLVFLSLSATQSGVVFCGDSPLGDGPNYVNSFFDGWPSCRFPIVATAPHHGSENNKAAYGHLERWARVSYWIRAGGSSKQPGPTFKAISPSKRLCTHCPQTGLALRRAGVYFGVAPFSASLGQTHRVCSCS